MSITRDSLWRHAGAVPYEIWKKRILDAGGLPEYADWAVWNVLGDDSALALAQLEAESSYASNFRKIPAGNWNAWNLEVEGVGQKFPNAVAGAKAWRDRLYSTTYKEGIYASTGTFEDLIYTYAPPKDPVTGVIWNDTEGYLSGILSEIKRNGIVTTTPGSPPPMNKFDPQILLNRVKKVERYVYKRNAGQGFDYGERGPIEGLFVHERQGRIGNDPKAGQQFFTCWTRESCDKYGICYDGERCEDALVDGEVLRDGTLVIYQDPFATDRIPYASGGKTQNWSNPVGVYINTNYPYVNDRFAAIETEKTDGERLSSEQIETIGLYGAYIIARGGRKKREFWQLPNHSDAYSSTNCAMFTDDRAKFEARCDYWLDQFWGGKLPEQQDGTTPPPDPVVYAPPAVVKGLEKYMDADPNTVPAVITAEGSKWIYVNDVVKVTTNTPRLQRASPTADKVGPEVKKGEDFTAKFLVQAKAGDWYYLTRYWTRIQIKDTTRSKDQV